MDANLSPERRSSNIYLLAALLLCAAVFAAFSPSLSNGFVNWDDDANLLDNPAWRGLSWQNLSWMFTTFHMGHYIPLTWLSFGADYAVWGLNPFGYHLTALLLHAANAVLFFFCLKRLLERAIPYGKENLVAASVFGALFFALHPLRVESVCWVTGRRDLLSGFFVLSSLLSYLRYAGSGLKKFHAASLALFGGAVLSRESTAAFPLALLLLDAYPLGRLRAGQWKAVLAEKIPFFALSALAAVLAVLATQHIDCIRPLAEAGLAHRAGLAVYSLAFYLWKTVLPLNFSHLYAIPPGFDVFSFPALLSAALLGIMAMLAWRWRRYPAFLTALSVYFVFIFPAGGFAATISLAYDRFSYLACLGFAALFGGAFMVISRKLDFRRCVLFFTVVVLLLGGRSLAQTFVWRDSASLWTNAIANGSPHFRAQALSARGKVYLESGQLELARADFEKSLGITLVDGAVLGLAQTAMLSGDEARATKTIVFMLERNLLPADALLLKSAMAMRRGDYNAAIAALGEAAKIAPEDCRIYNNRGLAYEKAGDLPAAYADYMGALSLKPGYALAAVNLARISALSAVKKSANK